jgi:hypothetical protein
MKLNKSLSTEISRTTLTLDEAEDCALSGTASTMLVLKYCSTAFFACSTASSYRPARR